MRRVTGDQLDASTLYALLRLRAEVFVVEQECPWLDPDGRDLDPSTVHLWHPDESSSAVAALATVRVTSEGAGRMRIGRVCCAQDARGRGLTATLMRAAIDELAGRECVIAAQAYLEDMYAGYGFVSDGPTFVEDGIVHVPMRRPAQFGAP